VRDLAIHCAGKLSPAELVRVGEKLAQAIEQD